MGPQCSNSPQAEPSRLRLAVVGFGKLGLLHSAIAHALPGCQLVAVSDPQASLLQALKTERPDLNIFTDHRELISQCPIDGVFIATPTHLHCCIAKDFVDAGIAIFVEKPLSTSPEESAQLLESLEEKKVIHRVGYMSRFCETFEAAAAIILGGGLGTLKNFRSNMYVDQLRTQGKGWRYQKNRSGGGVLIAQNSHLIDMLGWYFGDVEWVSAHVQSLYSTEVEDRGHVYFKFKSGLCGWMDTSWSERHVRTLTMEIHVRGDRGTLDVNDDEIRLYLDEGYQSYRAGWTILKKPDLFRPVVIDVAGPQYTKQSLAFVDAIRGGCSQGTDVFSAQRVQEVLVAAYASAESNGVPVEVKTR